MKKPRVASLIDTFSSARWIPSALGWNVISVLSVLAILSQFVAYVGHNQMTSFDDAYMFIRYAKNFLGGHGLAWNPDGVQTYGATSLLYLALVIMLQGSFPAAEPSILLTYTSTSLALLALLVLVLTCTRFAASKALKSSFLPVCAILATILLLSPVFRFHAVTGMDTTLSLLCNSLLILATLEWVRAENRYTWLLTLLAAYLSYLSRPDNLIYACAFPLGCAVLLTSHNLKRRVVSLIAGLCTLLALDTAFKFAVYGHPLPLPFYAKANGYYEGYSGAYQWNPVVYLFEFGALVLPFLIVIAFSLVKGSGKIACAFLAPVAVTFAYYFSVMQIMGSHARYYFPALPFFVVGSYLVLDHRIQISAREEIKEPVGRQLVRLTIILLLIATTPQASVQEAAAQAYERLPSRRHREYSSSARYTIPSQQPLPTLGWWEMIQEVSQIAASLPGGTKLALSEFGLVGAKAPQIHIVDLVGLHDPFFAHNGFSSSEFFRREPELIWFPHPHYTKIVSSILDSGEFWEHYDFYPGAFDYGLAIRRDSPRYHAIRDVVRESWRERYGPREMDEFLADLVQN